MTEIIESAAVELTALCALIIAAIVMLGKIHAASEKVLHQVRNDHGTNLRDDIDAIRNVCETIRGELRDERQARQDLADLADRAHSEIFRRLKEVEKHGNS